MAKAKEYTNPWVYRGEPFESENIEPGNFGFVYLITNTKTGKKYIGRKYFFTLKKEKGAKRRKRVETNWKHYYGSCVTLKADIAEHGEESFTREILSIQNTKGQVNYNEAKEQFKRDVLEELLESGDRAYYNDNIMSRYFAPREQKEEV